MHGQSTEFQEIDMSNVGPTDRLWRFHAPYPHGGLFQLSFRSPDGKIKIKSTYRADVAWAIFADYRANAFETYPDGWVQQTYAGTMPSKDGKAPIFSQDYPLRDRQDREAA